MTKIRSTTKAKEGGGCSGWIISMKVKWGNASKVWANAGKMSDLPKMVLNICI